MTGQKLRKMIIKTLEDAGRPLSFGEIVENIDIDDYLWIQTELYQLAQIGRIRMIRKRFGGALYSIE